MLEELVCSAAQRALDRQSVALSDLRTRTSTLVAAATLSASFLGAAAIGRSAPAWAVVSAMVAFLLTGGFAGWVLWPARVSFAVDADRVHGDLYPDREDPAAYLLVAAHGLRDECLNNEKVIERREFVFRLALVALGAETLLWALALALT
ncbi:MAG TPA: hypothetical protein VGL54_06275 [Solirubrobacteraceae bacterium]|jgi:hypothetical protein